MNFEKGTFVISILSHAFTFLAGLRMAFPKQFPVPISGTCWNSFLPFILIDTISISLIKMTSSINAFIYIWDDPKYRFAITLFANLYLIFVSSCQILFDIYNLGYICYNGYEDYKDNQKKYRKQYIEYQKKKTI